jgi:hypothetical protein
MDGTSQERLSISRDSSPVKPNTAKRLNVTLLGLTNSKGPVNPGLR